MPDSVSTSEAVVFLVVVLVALVLIGALFALFLASRPRRE
jgi:hypothetical protein